MIMIGETHYVGVTVPYRGDDDMPDDVEATEAVKRLVEELRECRTDLMIAAGNADNAAKHDHRWEGVGAVLRARVVMADAALAPFTESDASLQGGLRSAAENAIAGIRGIFSVRQSTPPKGADQ